MYLFSFQKNFKISENNIFSVETAEVLMVYFIGPSREQCMLCIFTSENEKTLVLPNMLLNVELINP
jgi:hypothetical protein